MSSRPQRPWRVAYLVTHPIQYQALLLRHLAADPDIDLTAFFESDFSVDGYHDVEFNREIAWDVPLLDGYRHVFLPRRSFPRVPREGFDFWSPMSRGLRAALRDGRFDALWVHGYSRAHHLLAMANAKSLGIKVLLRDEMADIGRARSAARAFVKRGLFGGLDALVDAYLTIGSRNEKSWRGLGVERERMFRMAYAVDNLWFRAGFTEAATRRETLRASLGLEPGRPVILYAAKLIARKAPFDLLNAFARVADRADAGRPYLLMAGDGDLRGQLEAQIASSGLKSAKLLGFQYQKQLAALYELCDLFILPSERESWGLVVNEVMNAGRAVIASDRVCAATDLVHEGVNGYVYTSEVEHEISTAHAGAAPARVVPLGVKLDAFETLPSPEEFRCRFPETAGRRIVLFLSRLHEKKGLDLLVPAFAAAKKTAPDLHLVLAGPDDGVLERTRALVAEHGVQDSTTFTGMLTGSDKLAAFAAASMFALPSYSENFGIAVVEAMAAGLPAIISDQVNIYREVGGHGTIVVPCEVPALTRAILDLASDPARACAMGVEARDTAKKLYDWRNVAAALEILYAEVAQ